MPPAADRGALRLRARLVLGVFVALGAAAGVAHAHGGRDADVRATLGALPDALAGVTIEVHETIAPQLVMANPTARVVEVLDDRGIAFVRVGPDGVAGNVAARAWFQTQGPGAVVPATATDGRQPRWIRMRPEPTFGWFDPRLDDAAIEVPHAVRDAAKAADVGRWQIPLRVDGTPVALVGTFRYQPPPSGAYTARLTSPAEIAPGVRVRILPGRTPGLLVKNTGQLPLTVLDDRGEPFLRIGPDGVDANVRSAAWAHSGRRVAALAAHGAPQAAAPQWKRVARTPSYGWIEPRVARPVEPPVARAAADAAPAGPLAWRIPVLLGDTPFEVTGVATWEPAAGGEENSPAAN